MRIDRITQPMISTFKDKRLRAGTSPRTVNLDQIALRNVLKWARKDVRLLPIVEVLPPTYDISRARRIADGSRSGNCKRRERKIRC